jgi:uncharacterized membrane protein
MRLPSRVLTAIAVLVTVAASRPAAAHKGHAHASPSPSPSPVASSAAAASPDDATAATPAPSPVAASPTPAAPPAPPGIDWQAALFEHMHNKIVHFPIVLGLTAAVILLGRARWAAYQPVAAALLAVGAVFGLAAYLTGGAQAEPFMGTPTEALVKQHATQGTLTGILLVAGAILTRVRAAHRWLWLYALFLILAISFTGLLGGLVAHGAM